MNSTAVWQWNGMVHGSKSLAVMSVATIESCMTAEYTDGTQCSALRCEGALGLHIIIMADLGDLEDRDRLPGNSAAGVRPRRCY
jgi:hypothetical protein